MNRVIVVDENDEEIGLKTYEELQYKDIYRVTALWLTDKSGEYCLTTQRKWTKSNDPGKWMVAVSGTVEENETYDENIVIEIEEEIGLKSLKLKKEHKSYIDDGKHKFFTQWYSSSVDRSTVVIIPQEEELEDYKWVRIEALVDDVTKTPNKYVPSMKKSLKLLGAIE